MIILLIAELVIFVAKMLGLATKLTWGLIKGIFSIAFLPIMIIVMIFSGLIKIALPVVLIGLIFVFLLSKIKK